jgi:hypothetical protein
MHFNLITKLLLSSFHYLEFKIASIEHVLTVSGTFLCPLVYATKYLGNRYCYIRGPLPIMKMHLSHNKTLSTSLSNIDGDSKQHAYLKIKKNAPNRSLNTSKLKDKSTVIRIKHYSIILHKKKLLDY